jgi:hypothetical protein
VKAVVQPSIPTRAIIVGFYDPGRLEVDIERGTVGVIQSHEQSRQRMLLVAVEIVGFMLVENASLGDGGRPARLGDKSQDRGALKLLARISQDGNDTGDPR